MLGIGRNRARKPKPVEST